MKNSGKRRNLERIARGVATGALKSVDTALATGFPTRVPDDMPRPVFIVGVPRSGTTVVYQAMTTAWHFAYINNVTARFPRSIARASRLLRAHRWAVSKEFRNFAGGTPGSAGPNEAVAVWAHAFPSDTHEAVQPEEVDPDRERWLVASVACLADQFQAPFISKTPCNSLRISALASIFPKALFVVVKRNLLEVAQSLLAARRQRCGNERGHYSVIPRGLEKRGNLPPVEYVAEQVSLTEIAIREAQNEIPGTASTKSIIKTSAPIRAARSAGLKSSVPIKAWNSSDGRR
ncbi:hypothetical protein GCM10011494_35210 [Novosphingobium endophyticum]|uniref:Sulfotransferase n=1 Tax=Novosphingobium endophyticum TaxID=1955250 RepID=A0A916X711_9SPHN|nr:sulfotransferase [Novosphingobium endophyticum]GGC13288.1 hypothetical protein GCM10011494_35210 [Novosphingobium endophyticum]